MTKLCYVSVIAFAVFAYADEGPALRVGAASAPITPPAGTFIAGDARNRVFEGVHDDLFAKAVVFDDGKNAVAIVTLDCIGLLYPDVQKIQAAAATRAELPRLRPEQIIVASTHTHSGPDVVGLWGRDATHSGVDKAYMKFLVETAAEQVARAAGSLQGATLMAASGRSEVDWVQNICEEGVLDRTLSVMKVTGEDGTCIATLTNFACHPTILDGVHDVVSSDWIGGHYLGMSEALPGEHLYLQGAVGGWVQPEKGDRSFALAERYGRELAGETLALLQSAARVQDPAIRFARKELAIPLENPGWRQLGELGVLERRLGDTVETEIAAFRIGGVGFATHVGETPPSYSKRTRELLGTETTFVVGLGLDALGYVLLPDYFTTPDQYPHAEYLTSMSVGPQAGPLMMGGLAEIIAGLGTTR